MPTAAALELRWLPLKLVSTTGARDILIPRWPAGARLLLTAVVAVMAMVRVLGTRRRVALLLLAAGGPANRVSHAGGSRRPGCQRPRAGSICCRTRTKTVGYL